MGKKMKTGDLFRLKFRPENEYGEKEEVLVYIGDFVEDGEHPSGPESMSFVEAYLVSRVDENWEYNPDLIGPADIYFDAEETGLGFGILVRRDILMQITCITLKNFVKYVGTVQDSVVEDMKYGVYIWQQGEHPVKSGKPYVSEDPRVIRKQHERILFYNSLPDESEMINERFYDEPEDDYEYEYDDEGNCLCDGCIEDSWASEASEKKKEEEEHTTAPSTMTLDEEIDFLKGFLKSFEQPSSMVD